MTQQRFDTHRTGNIALLPITVVVFCCSKIYRKFSKIAPDTMNIIVSRVEWVQNCSRYNFKGTNTGKTIEILHFPLP